MGISVSPSIMPRSFTHQKTLISRKKMLCITAEISIGQNNSFICSQVDSFTPESGAIHAAFPSQSYKKCKIVPPREVTAKPNSCQSPIERSFMFSPSRILCSILYSKKRVNIPNETLTFFEDFAIKRRIPFCIFRRKYLWFCFKFSKKEKSPYLQLRPKKL